mmetsp:Transcript_26195/g.62302  ORF Transcript_26195/g.62302 Transcript_26195/m.62302 type:complete len:414 (-) Transcript_26195:294-1535(-)
MGNLLIVKGSGPYQVERPLCAAEGSSVAEVAVDRKCGEAVLRGAPVYVPGVLGCSPKVQPGDPVAVSVSLAAMTRGTTLGSEHDAGARDGGRFFLGMGEALMGRSEIFRRTEGMAVRMVQPLFRIPHAEGLLPGAAMLQNLPSAVAAAVLAPRPGTRVLDMCAAPGGKTTALAELSGDAAEVVALDRTHAKVSNIVRLAEELGLSSIRAYKMDASKAVLRDGCAADELRRGQPRAPQSAKAEARRQRREAAMLARGIEPSTPTTYDPPCGGWPPAHFDYILLDAPCSGLGLRPRLAQTATLRDLEGAAAYQRRLLEAAVALLRPGGFLVYSTCSIWPGENEANVRYALDRFGCLELVPAEPQIGGPGLTAPSDREFASGWLTETEAEKVQRFDPASALDTIGFFIAKFQKKNV